MDVFDRNEVCIIILDETVKDLERYLGEKPVLNVAKRTKSSRDKFLELRQNLKALEVSISRDLADAEKFEQLTKTFEERTSRIEITMKIVKESSGKDIVMIRRNLDLIKVCGIFRSYFLRILSELLTDSRSRFAYVDS